MNSTLPPANQPPEAFLAEVRAAIERRQGGMLALLVAESEEFAWGQAAKRLIAPARHNQTPRVRVPIQTSSEVRSEASAVTGTFKSSEWNRMRRLESVTYRPELSVPSSIRPSGSANRAVRLRNGED